LAEWLYEAGIGEARAALVEDGEIVEARIERDGERPRLGAIVAAKLVEAGRGGKGALIALDCPGQPHATLADVPPATSIGARLTVQVTRMALRERGRDKPARARLAEPAAALASGPDLRARIAANGVPVVDLRSTDADRLEQAGWSELIDCVRTGHWTFDGGALWVDATPAMVLIDVDGEGDALALAKAGARAAAAVIRRCDVGGSIGIDFPSLGGRAESAHAIDAAGGPIALAAALRAHCGQWLWADAGHPPPRSALAGRAGADLDPVATDAALLLRQAERAVGAGCAAP
jgi:hypothetical protein